MNKKIYFGMLCMIVFLIGLYPVSSISFLDKFPMDGNPRLMESDSRNDQGGGNAEVGGNDQGGGNAGGDGWFEYSEKKAKREKRLRDAYTNVKDWKDNNWYEALGGSLLLGDTVAFLMDVVGWVPFPSYTKSVDELFNNFAGGIFDAENWENNICAKWFHTVEDGSVFVASGNDILSYKSAARISAEKSVSFEVPNGTTYRYYFITWQVASLKKAGLSVKVKMYPGGELIDSKVMGVETWTPGPFDFESNKNYDKACVEFENSDLYNYFDYSSGDGKLCQDIAQIG